MTGLVSVVGAVVAMIGVVVTGWLTYRGTQTAARIAAAPQAKQADLAVLEASVNRLKEECGELRRDVTRLRGLLWSVLPWVTRMRAQITALGGEPEPTPDDVEEFYRTGV